MTRVALKIVPRYEPETGGDEGDLEPAKIVLDIDENDVITIEVENLSKIETLHVLSEIIFAIRMGEIDIWE